MRKSLKVGVLGVGNMGKNHMRVLSSMPECELVGCYDLDSERTMECATLYGTHGFAAPEEMFGEADSVHIVVPSFLHGKYSIEAMRHGCHVLIEKPIALTQEEAQSIIDVATETGVKSCVGHVERFNPAIITLKEILTNEDVIQIEFRRMSPFDARVSDASVVQDLMIHDIDTMNALFGASIQSINACGSKVYSDKLDYAQALVILEKGPIVSLIASRVTESKIRTVDISCRKCFIHVDLLSHTLEISRKTNFKLDVGHPIQYCQENIIEKVIVPRLEPLRLEFEHFYQCIRDDIPVEPDCRMGKMALKISDLITETAESSGHTS